MLPINYAGNSFWVGNVAVSYHSVAFSSKSRKCVRFEVMAVTMKSNIFWNVAPCSLVVVYICPSVGFYHIMQHHIPEESSLQGSTTGCFHETNNAMKV
jgi:hypothetical protein